MIIPSETKNWLLESTIPYIRYNAAQLFGQQGDKSVLLSDPFIQENIALLAGWETEVLKQHNKPELLMHRLALLADLGITSMDPGMEKAIASILKCVNEEGFIEVIIEIPKVFGGTGVATRDWMLCDFPTVLYGLLKMGVRNEATARAVELLVDRVSENGYRCGGSNPRFRGPGKKADICPYVNLIAAKALSEDPVAAKSDAALKAVEGLLHHWEIRGQVKFYMFGIGSDFRKLKFPLVWYNILHFLEVISRYEGFRKDPRFLEILAELEAKALEGLRFKAESMYRPFKEQDFSDKKGASPTITLFALRILKRLGRVEI